MYRSGVLNFGREGNEMVRFPIFISGFQFQ